MQGPRGGRRLTSVSASPSAELFDETTFYDAFARDPAAARSEVLLFTPFVGKTRWPHVEPHVAALPRRGVRTIVFHKPLSDPEWRRGDPDFGRRVFAALEREGAELVAVSGVHAKTIVIDGSVVFEGSLNWASQTSGYEHVWRFRSAEMARLVARMLQVRAVSGTLDAARDERRARSCPKCGGELILVSQARLNTAFGDHQPLKWACSTHAEDKTACDGYLRRVDARAPFVVAPTCPKGQRMTLGYSSNGKPWAWRCEHRGCRQIRWASGDVLE